VGHGYKCPNQGDGTNERHENPYTVLLHELLLLLTYALRTWGTKRNLEFEVIIAGDGLCRMEDSLPKCRPKPIHIIRYIVCSEIGQKPKIFINLTNNGAHGNTKKREQNWQKNSGFRVVFFESEP
jgi:hypothetical protein